MASDILWRRIAAGRVLHAFEQTAVRAAKPTGAPPWAQWWVSACGYSMIPGEPPDRGERARCRRCVYEIEGRAAA